MARSRKEEHADLVEHWEESARQALEGRTIVKARYLTEEEREALGWSQQVLVIQLDDGSILYPSMDDEGNDGGSMFGQNKEGVDMSFPVIRNYG